MPKSTKDHLFLLGFISFAIVGLIVAAMKYQYLKDIDSVSATLTEIDQLAPQR